MSCYSSNFSFYFKEKDLEDCLIKEGYTLMTFKNFLKENYGEEVLKKFIEKSGISNYSLGKKIAYLESEKAEILSNISTQLTEERWWGLRYSGDSLRVDSVCKELMRNFLSIKFGKAC